MRRLNGLAIALVVALICSRSPSLHAAPFLFDDPTKVNLLQADNISITSQFTSGSSFIPAQGLRGVNDTNVGWDGGTLAAGQKNAITIDFKESRNISQIQTWANFGSYNINSATIQTSNDGVNWTNQSNTLSVDAPKSRVTINLGAAVDSRFLKIIGDTYQNGPGANENARWIIMTMRVLGQAPTLDAGWHLDVVSRSALSNGVTLTRDVGSVSITDVSDNQFVDDAYSPITRAVMFSMGTNDGFTLHWDREIAAHRFAFLTAGTGTIDTGASWKLEGWTGAGTPQLIMTHTGQAIGFNLFDLPNYFVGDTLRFTYTSTTSSDNRISDIQVFVPEPMSAAAILMGVASPALLSRRRRG